LQGANFSRHTPKHIFRLLKICFHYILSKSINIYDLKMVSTGLTEAKAKKLGMEVECTDFEDTQKPAFIETENPKVKIRIVYDKKTRIIVLPLFCWKILLYNLNNR